MNRWTFAVLSVFLLLPHPASAAPLDTCEDSRATGRCPEWISAHDSPTATIDEAAAAALSPDRKTLVVLSAPSDYVTVAFDAATGERLWSQIYDGGNVEYARALAISPTGDRVFVTGYRRTGNPPPVPPDNRVYMSEAVTIAYDLLTGEEVWRATPLGGGEAGAEGTAIAVSQDGARVFVTGSSADPVTHRSTYGTFVLDADTGDTIWFRPHRTSGFGASATALAVAADGETVYVTGEDLVTHEATPPDPNQPPRLPPQIPARVDVDVVTVAYQAATGVPLWQHVWDGAGAGDDFARRILLGPAGEVYIAGSTEMGEPYSGHELLLLHLDPEDGSEVWATTVDTPGERDEKTADAALAPSGERIFLTGPSSKGGDAPTVDHLTVAFQTSDGAEVWRHVARGVADDGDLRHRIAVSPDGSTVVQALNDEESGPRKDVVTTALASGDGRTRWRKIHDGGWTDRTAAVIATPDGTLTVGDSDGALGRDLVVVAHDEQGRHRWTGRSNLRVPGTDQVAALAATADGSTAFVAGTSELGRHPIQQERRDTTIVAVDGASGTAQWLRRISHGGEDRVRTIELAPDERTLFVTGTSESPEGERLDGFLIALAVETGEVLWSAPPAPGADPHDLVVSPDGERVFVVGDGFGLSGSCSVAVHGADDGRLFWQRGYPGPEGAIDGCRTGALSPDGSMLAVGGFADTGDHDLVLSLVETSTGSRRWRRTITGPVGQQEDAKNLAFSENGSRLVVNGDTGSGVVTAVYDTADADRIWIDVWAASGVAGLEVGDGMIFTTAFVHTDTHARKVDPAVTKYHLAIGTQLWRQSYDESLLTELPTSSALSPDGSELVVAGQALPIQPGDRMFALGIDVLNGQLSWSSAIEARSPASERFLVATGGDRAFVAGSPSWEGSSDLTVAALQLGADG